MSQIEICPFCVLCHRMSGLPSPLKSARSCGSVTVKHAAQTAVPSSGLCTVTSRAPSGALFATATVACSVVGFTTLTALVDTPVPEKDTVAPLAKFVPVRTTDCADAPRPIDAGDSDASEGAGLTVKQVVHVTVPPSEFVTVM